MGLVTTVKVTFCCRKCIGATDRTALYACHWGSWSPLTLVSWQRRMFNRQRGLFRGGLRWREYRIGSRLERVDPLMQRCTLVLILHFPTHPPPSSPQTYANYINDVGLRRHINYFYKYSDPILICMAVSGPIEIIQSLETQYCIKYEVSNLL